MRIYFDNCCFNRPFDDQSQVRIRLESEAKLVIQEQARSGQIELAWSYILDFENLGNPFVERRERIKQWREHAVVEVEETPQVLQTAQLLARQGLRNMDALHVACAVAAMCDYFLTVDDGILSKSSVTQAIRIDDPIGFVKKEISR